MFHKLKTRKPYFDHLWSGEKRFELRKDDRHFAVGDTLVLDEWDSAVTEASGRRIHATVGYILREADGFGLINGHVIMGLTVMSNIDDRKTP